MLTRSSLGLLLGVGFLVGCGGPKGSVSGTVTLDGKPLDRAAVVFHSEAPGGATAYGNTVADGSYVLQTGAKEEVPPGDYLVTVVATEEVKMSQDPSKPPEPPKTLTPARYADTKASGFRFTVKPGVNTFDLPLKSQ